MFDYTSSIRSRKTIPCTPDMFDIATHATKVSKICAEIADYREKKLRGEMSREDFETKKSELKRQLPAFLFHAHYSDGHRSNASAVPSGLSIYDLDHIGGLSRPPQRGGDGVTLLKSSPTLGDVLKQHVLEHKPITDGETIKKMKALGIVLAHISPSGEGLRLVFVIPPASVYLGNTDSSPLGRSGEAVLPMAQKWLANQLGDKEFDESCKDLARCSFAVPADYILYIDKDELFADHTVSPVPSKGGEMGITSSTAQQETEDTATSHTSSSSPLGRRGEAALRIFDETVSAANLTLDNLNAIGTRHNSLVTILSMGICRLMAKEQLEAVVRVRMPEFSKEPDCRQLIDDFYSKYTDPTKPMSGKLRKIFTDSLKTTGGSAAAVPKNKQINFQPRQLPPALRATIESVPVGMRMPVLCAVLPLAAAYADGVTVRYCDGQLQRLNLMSIIVGPQASGKSSCKQLVDIWIGPMEDADERAREIEYRWRQKRFNRKANEKGEDDPHVLIRSVPITISCSTLLKRLKNAKGHCLYSFAEELDTLLKTNGAGQWSQKYDVYRLGFDNGKWGQDYNSDQAESGVANVAYNLTILGTYGALHRFFRPTNVENGLSSRVIIAEMPDSSFAAMPQYKPITAQQRADILEGVKTLSQASGFVDTPRLRKHIARWVESKRLEAMSNADFVMDTYRKRAAVIGFRCGVVYYLLTGKESRACLQFASDMAEYVLEGQCRVFGEMLLKEINESSAESIHSSTNNRLFDSLPDTFTMTDIKKIKGSDTTNNCIRVIITRWKANNWIEKTDNGVWHKKVHCVNPLR